MDRPGLGINDGGTRSGFEVDLATALARELGYDLVEWVDVTTSDAATRVASGDADFALAGVGPSGSQTDDVDLAGPYLWTGLDLLVAADDDSIQGPEDLEGKNTCTIPGREGGSRVKNEYAAGTNLLEQKTLMDCVTALISGTVDAVPDESVLLLGYSQLPGYDGKTKLVANPFSQIEYSVVVPHDSGRCEAVNDALQRLLDSGEWFDIFVANFGNTSLGDVPNPPSPATCS